MRADALTPTTAALDPWIPITEVNEARGVEVT